MKKRLEIIVIVAAVLLVIFATVRACKYTGFEFQDYTVCGYSRSRIISLDVGVYETVLKIGDNVYTPGEIIVYEVNNEKFYVLRVIGQSDIKIPLNQHLFEE